MNMTEQQALQLINEALRKTLNDPKASAGIDTDLVSEDILDSLDGMVFLLEISEKSGKSFPEKDLVELGFFRVRKLVEILTA
jgi:acyl carrier protein